MAALAEGLKRYFTPAQLRALASARIGIAGTGGLGSNVAMLLARSGVRRFVLVDGDTVDSSNLNRQFFWPEDVGAPKAEALRQRLLSLEPDLDCRVENAWLTPESAAGIFAGCSLVVEALDDARLKAGICSALLAGGFFVVAASGLGGFGGPPMQARKLGASLICVGDFTTGVDERMPPLAPRVMQAAAMQADAALHRILESYPGCALAEPPSGSSSS